MCDGAFSVQDLPVGHGLQLQRTERRVYLIFRLGDFSVVAHGLQGPGRERHVPEDKAGIGIERLLLPYLLPVEEKGRGLGVGVAQDPDGLTLLVVPVVPGFGSVPQARARAYVAYGLLAPQRGAEMAVKQDRVMGVVSRGGSMLARWMLENGKENPLLEYFDRLIDVCRQFNVTLSLGDGLRPGAGVDAGDAAQWEEVITLGRLAKYALEQGVQCMIEGPGHVPMNQVRTQIQGIKRLTNNAPLYVLGPLCCDSAPGYDHIAGAIGGALGVEAGVDFLCYLTPAEHLTLPNEEDVRAGVMASRVAAHVGEVALGRERAVRREATMNAGRKALDWDMMREAALDPQQLDKRREDHKHEDVCAMCGKFCAVKMLKDQKKD